MTSRDVIVDMNLFMSSDEAQWNKALVGYKKSITFVEKSKKKDINLQELDEWYKRSCCILANLILRYRKGIKMNFQKH